MPRAITPSADAPVRRARDTDEPDLVRAYLDEIGRTPLLTAADEVELSQRIEAGVYAAELLRRHEAGEQRVTAKRSRDLELVARDGDAAKDHMLRANLRLVVAVAKKYANRDLPFLDIVQEGNLGLIRAVEKFDYTKGYKFSTYATWWIRQSIQRGLAEQSRTVRLPVHVVEELSKLNRAERTLTVKLGQPPTAEETAAELGIDVERVEELRRVGRSTVSLDSPVGDDDTVIGDLVADPDAPSVGDLVEHQALTGELARLVHTLPPREALIIEMRFGLRDGNPRTLEEVARHVGLTRERIRQLEKKSLSMLRHPSNTADLLAWAS